MPQKKHIEPVTHISPAAVSEPVEAERPETVDGRPDSIAEIALNRSFWDTAFGRTLSGKTNAGKIAYGILGAAVTFFTGINIQPITSTLTEPTMTDFFTDLNFWTILAFAFGILVTWLKTKTGATLDRLLDKADLGADMYADFKGKESDEGTKISDKERDQLLDLFGSIFTSQQKHKN